MIVAMKDYYDTLQISPSASEEVIKAAYKAMAKLYHPDTTKYDKITAEQQMKLINEAFQILSDPQKRKEYDAVRASEMGGAHQNNAYRPEKREPDLQPKQGQPGSVQQEKPSSAQSNGKPKNKFFSFLSSIGKSISEEIQKNDQIRDNAYMDGLNMPTIELVRTYRKETGYRRAGYERALEDRGLLERNSDGKLILTDEFLRYWR